MTPSPPKDRTCQTVRQWIEKHSTTEAIFDMSLPLHDENLKRLQADAEASPAGLARASSSQSRDLARDLPLVHARSQSVFVEIATNHDGTGCKLLSPSRIAEQGIEPGQAEIALGTTGFVFLYCGQFRYPGQVGFLFATTLERDRAPDCEASPFDSGALHRKVTLPPRAGSAAAFLARHTLPVPGYRVYMANRLEYLFAEPADYLKPDKHPIRLDPIGLTPNPPTATPDARLWTFEVRVRDEVAIVTPHLEALFYPAGLEGLPELHDFFAELSDYVNLVSIHEDEQGDFVGLQNRCLEYLRTRGLIQ